MSGEFIVDGPGTIYGFAIGANNGEPIVTIHFDGRVTVNPKYSTEEAAEAFWKEVQRLAVQPARPAIAEALRAAAYEDSMIAHRWFEATFGETFKGRDFAIKCPMADREMAQQRERAAFGDQCWQDQCEGALIEASVVKKLEAQLRKEIERLEQAHRRIATMECHAEGSLPVTPSELREISRDVLQKREPV